MSNRINGMATAVVAMGLAVALTGCGGSSQPGHATAKSSSGATPSGTAGSTGASTGSASASATAPSPAGLPLTGPVATLDAGSVHLPAGWTVKDGGADWALTMCPPEAEGISCMHFSDIHDPQPDGAVDALVKAVGTDYGRPWKRLPDVTLGGLPFFHLVDAKDKATYNEEYGTTHADRDVILEFRYEKGMASKKQRRAEIDAITASFQPN